MRIEDLAGRRILRSKKAVKTSGDVHLMLAFSHSELAGAAHKAANEGRHEEAARFEEIREGLFALIKKLDEREEPTVKLNGRPANRG